jgi:hypothetical protein
VALVWVAVGIVLTIWVSIARPSALEQGGRVFVEDETAAAAAPAGR